ncbi:MAG TPA: hypothetical protein VHQ90_13150 [Thermoanaerobaculia bacterium]|nr:hypothetical protein [Thermoanaerobaculia bacterium]
MKRLVAVLLTLTAGGLSIAASWQSWINPLVDSGREMFVPWRLEHGDRLYRDVTYYYGPVGPWVSALALRLFGDRWVVLELVSAALAAAIFVLLFKLTRQAGSAFSATVATTLAAALCMGAPRGGAFMFPYSSSNLFALAGALLALTASCAPPSQRGHLNHRSHALAVLGLALALASRLEIGGAAAVAILLAGLRSHSRRAAVVSSAAVVAAGSALAAAVYGFSFLGVPAANLFSDGPFTHLITRPQEWRSFYLDVAGLLKPGQAASRLGISALLDALILTAAAFLGVRRRNGQSEAGGVIGTVGAIGARRRYLFAAAAALVVGVYCLSPLNDPNKNLPPLLAILPPLAALAALALLRRPLEGPRRARFLLFFFSAAVAVRVLFALSAGPRMGAYDTPPLPGLLATAAVLLFDCLAPRLPAPAGFRWRLAAILLVFGGLFLYRIAILDSGPRLALLETRAGSFRLPARQAEAIGQALDFLARHTRPGDTLTAFPESGFFNFVTGLPSPLRQDQIFPGVLYGQREAEVARQIDLAGPRYVLLCNRPTSEYGPRSFGIDFAILLWKQVEDRYHLVGSFGPAWRWARVGAKRFFVRVYERNPDPPGPAQAAARQVLASPGGAAPRLP